MVLAIGEEVERLVGSSEQGNSETFIALAEQLRQTANKYEIEMICMAASRAIAVANKDAQIENLVKQSFELLVACRELKAALSDSAIECGNLSRP